MASGFPGSIDNFTDPLSNSSLSSPSHAGQHADLNDAVEKIETYMGLVKVIPTGATNGTVAANGTVTIGNAVSSVTVSGAFSANYDNYIIQISGGAGSQNADVYCRLGSTATGYRYGFRYNAYGTASVAVITSNAATEWPYVGVNDGNAISVRFHVYQPYLAKYSFVAADYASPINGGASGNLSGVLTDTTQYTSFLVAPVGGTWTGGTIRVYGYRN